MTEPKVMQRVGSTKNLVYGHGMKSRLPHHELPGFTISQHQKHPANLHSFSRTEYSAFRYSFGEVGLQPPY